jgi:hypothetical protein
MRNRTKHELSWLTAISDAGSTPAASTSLRPLGDGSGSACQFSLQNRLSWLNAGEGGLPHAIRSALLVIPDQHKRRPVKRMRQIAGLWRCARFGLQSPRAGSFRRRFR